jgi:glycosyltransferase involved in cell wall biosynthesis
VSFYVTARTSHVDRLQTPDTILLYQRASYDFEPAIDKANQVAQVSLWSGLWRIWKLKPLFVEVNEPAMVKAWPSLLITCLFLRFFRLFSRRNFQPVTYAIENQPPSQSISAYFHIPLGLAKVACTPIVMLLCCSMTRIAFGTSQAFDVYREVLGSRGLRLQTKVFEAVEPPCALCEQELGLKDRSIVFLGAFEDRKGITRLTAAWDLAQGQQSLNSQLVIPGKGQLEDQVSAFAWSHSNVALILDPTRAEIHHYLSRASVLVLLSQRTKTWREQVGLPILEGLSHGCHIVASSDTGISSWLEQNGHTVLSSTSDPIAILTALSQAISDETSLLSRLSRLPSNSQREEAQNWLTA